MSGAPAARSAGGGRLGLLATLRESRAGVGGERDGDEREHHALHAVPPQMVRR
jgi:hypothetical protein